MKIISVVNVFVKKKYSATNHLSIPGYPPVIIYIYKGRKEEF
ncbi:MAG: hypothetical protein ABIB61_01285 [Candidatus Shapirobacteria bacterium]